MHLALGLGGWCNIVLAIPSNCHFGGIEGLDLWLFLGSAHDGALDHGVGFLERQVLGIRDGAGSTGLSGRVLRRGAYFCVWRAKDFVLGADAVFGLELALK